MTTFDDSPYGKWLLALMQNCLIELGEGKSGVDMNRMVQMCKDEPKSAQVAMQLLAQELETALGGKALANAEGMAQTYRLLLGCLYMAYSVSRNCIQTVPPELEQIIRWHPVIVECANFVSSTTNQPR